jgi:predicted nucleic acid-binding protein
VIYLDTSVAIAQLLAEDLQPRASLWDEPLVSSRLLEYEVWNRVHARGLTSTHGEHARSLLARIAFLEMVPPVLARALEPFPVPVRTLDALHLASVHFLLAQGKGIELATYDERLATAARRLGITLADL